MWGYAYINCSSCKRKLKIRIGQKTRLCPYCGSRTETR